MLGRRPIPLTIVPHIAGTTSADRFVGTTLFGCANTLRCYNTSMKNYTYPNNAEWANRIGWARVPDRCIGRHEMPYVRHEHHQGRFVYTCQPGNLVVDTAQFDAIVLK